MEAQDKVNFERFVRGLRNHNITYDDLIKNRWRYAGGNGDITSYSKCKYHYNYFKLCFPNMEPLDAVNKCVCGHYIKENCYVSDFEGHFIIIGNCCIQKFIPLYRRTCEDCFQPHKNRKINKCNACRGVKGKVYSYDNKTKSKPKWDWTKWEWAKVDDTLCGVIKTGDTGIIRDVKLVTQRGGLN